MMSQIKRFCEKIIDKCINVKDYIRDYFIWLFYDGFSWSLIERYKIDDTNKKIIGCIWLLIVSIIGLILFSIELFYINSHSSVLLFLSIFVFILVYFLIAISTALELLKLTFELYVKSCQAIFQYPEYMSNEKHSAIIYIHYEKPLIDQGISDIPSLLIEGFQKNKIPYKVYHIFNPENFESIFYNNLVTDLWIIGHGDHGGFSYGRKRRNVDYFSYSNLDKKPPKHFIAQLHCNCGDEESLVSINHPYEGFVTDRILTLTQIRYYVITKMRELDQKHLFYFSCYFPMMET